GYAAWLPDDWRLVVLVDLDQDDCMALKGHLEEVAWRAGLTTRTRSEGSPWRLVNRIAIEELEAWYFGDWAAVCSAYPRVPANVPSRQPFRDPDGVRGGTWEAFEREMRRCGYFKGGLSKIEAAREIGTHVNPTRSSSRSFRTFWNAIAEAFS
ncbi:DUF4276 family protein, partial [Tepidiforma sp.]|uniref:DUF4276 family protein n=1 Tax=Tepidiforma sp. TaxID=2682230 RepID=UPI002621BBBE